jgi:hypothetical protein
MQDCECSRRVDSFSAICYAKVALRTQGFCIHGASRMRVFHVWLVIAILLVGTAFSVRWMYPLERQVVSNGAYTFVPLRYGPAANNDDYFYYARIKEIINGRWLSFDPIVYESGERVSPHTTYLGSFIMCALGGLFTGKTAHAYYVNSFVYPALSFLMAYLLICGVSRDRYLSLALATVAVFFGMVHSLSRLSFLLSTEFAKAVQYGASDMLLLTWMRRTPNILFTNVHLLAFLYVLFLSLCRRVQALWVWIALTLLLGYASLVSSANFVVCHSLFLGCLVACRREIPSLRPYLTVWFVACVLSLPGVWLTLRATALFPEMMVLSTLWEGSTEYGSIYVFLRIAVYLGGPILLLSLLRPRYMRFLVGALSGVLCLYVCMCVAKGYYWGSEIVARGADVLVSVLFLGGLASALTDRLEKAAANNRVAAAYRVSGPALCIIFSLGMTGAVILNQYHVTEKNYAHYNKPDFKALYEWSLTNTSSSDVAMTLDFDLLTNLPASSPLRLYIPQAILSPRPHAERYKRFYETAAFYGLTAEDVDHLLKNMVSFSQVESASDDKTLQGGLMELVLFYGMYYREPISENERSKLVDDYRRVRDRNGPLSFKADYLIVSDVDRPLIRPGSKAAQVITREPVFKDRAYRVYKLLKPEAKWNVK